MSRSFADNNSMTAKVQPTAKTRIVTDKKLGFSYMATGEGERVNPKLKRMLEPVDGGWAAFTYENRSDESYDRAFPETLHTDFAMHWLSGSKEPLPKTSFTYEVKMRLTKKEMETLRCILNSGVVPSTTRGLNVQAALLAAMDAAC